MGASGMRTWRCRAAAVEPGRAATFEIQPPAGRSVHGFVVGHEGRDHAYVNPCPHAGARLGRGPGRFFTDDGLYLVCAAPGAVFAPATGICVERPCPGARLLPLDVQRDGDELVITWPG